jgi:hypothetical protein
MPADVLSDGEKTVGELKKMGDLLAMGPTMPCLEFLKKGSRLTKIPMAKVSTTADFGSDF